MSEIQITPEALRDLQLATRREGRCGSLQTHDGTPCRRWPRAGWTVCRKHGERAPATIAKAERILAAARMPALEWVLDALDQAQESTCETCGFPTHSLKERKRIDSLAIKVFDRTGLGPRSTIDLNAKTNENGFDVSSLSAVELEELDQLIDRMEELKSRVQARLAREAMQKVLAPDGSTTLLLSEFTPGDDPPT